MKFELIPILDKMAKLYKLPRTDKRFETYLFMLQGEQKKEMILPIAGYNPMGNNDVLLRIEELKSLEAEKLIKEILAEINRDLTQVENRIFGVVINLVDDLGGAWSNYSSTDYRNKFDLEALIKRNFCTPYFWMSERFTKELIVQRTKESVYRTIYCLSHGSPKSLKAHFEQELFVQIKASNESLELIDDDFKDIEIFYNENSPSKNYNLIFNFFYGDEASKELGYSSQGRKQLEGFDFVKYQKEKIIRRKEKKL